MSPAAYDRNNLDAPGFEIITAAATVQGSSSLAADEQARRALATIAQRGGRVLRAWINPGPDYRLGPIYASCLEGTHMADAAAPVLTQAYASNVVFGAVNAAEADLEARGFSVARMQAHQPSGILFGDFDIQKWRNLSTAHREALHGQMTGDFRNGPVTVRIFDTAPDEAKEAFCRATLAGQVQLQAAE